MSVGPSRLQAQAVLALGKDVAAGLFECVYRESVGRIVDEMTEELLETLQAYPDVKTGWRKPQSLSTMPFIPGG